MTEKTCSTCRQTKPISEFYKGGPGYRDGYKGQCKACYGEKTAAYAKAHPEIARAATRKYDAKRRTDPEAIAKRRASANRRYRERNPVPKKPGRPANPDNLYNQRTTDGRRRYRLRAKYGLEAGQFEAMLESQGNACKICGCTEPEYGWNVDHDHVTGAVRGILCFHCNTGLGHFKDSQEVVASALAYLEVA